MTTGRSYRKYRRSYRSAPPVLLDILEQRIVLSADVASFLGTVTSDDLIPHHDEATPPGYESTVGFYLPPQRQLSSVDSLLTEPTEGDPFEIGVNFLREHAAELGVAAADFDHFVVTSQYTDEHSGTTHIYLRQTIGSLEVMNADVSISLTADGEVIHVAASFVDDSRAMASESSPFIISAAQAFMGLSDDLQLGLQSIPQIISIDSTSPKISTLLSASGVSLKDVPATLVYVPTAEGLQLAWRINVQTPDKLHWFDGFVDADSGESIYVDDWVGHATYNVAARPLESPNDGARSIVTDPQDATASPFGWHDTDGVAGAEFTDTQGNNAIVQEDADANDTGGFRPSGGASLDFNFPLDVTQDPANYQSAAISNMFYWVNVLHDIHYQYGFTEAAGNFQTNNYGNGGKENDAVIADVQNGDGGDPAFFTPPDGQSPRMSMPINSAVSPKRDAAFDNGVLIHEYGHGVSERLTGGPANNTALNAAQSGGMAEGWSDWWALMLTQVPGDTQSSAHPIGNYFLGQTATGPGARRFPYSFDKTINPLTMADYNNASTSSSRHRTGEIWASALWDMNCLLINRYGFSSDIYHGNGGNNLALRLVMDGLKLQGTNPSYLSGRDAILSADVALTGGQNHPEIWAAFARRGMGFSAVDSSASASTVTEAFDVPGTISGTVFRDDDGNGVKGSAEPGLQGWTVYRDLNDNGVPDVATTTTFNSTDTPRTITDKSNIKSPIVISGLAGTIIDVNVTLNLTHPIDSELNLALLPPSGTPVILAQFLGGNGSHYTNTVFDDEASTYITSASAPFTGSFKPYFQLSQLDGGSPNGTWQLRIDDVITGNVGSLLSWSMQVTYGSPDPAAVTDANGNYTFFSVGNGTHHIREVIPPGFTRTAPASGVNNVVTSSGVPVVGQNFGNRSVASVAGGSTLEDTLSATIAINSPAGLGATHFRISGITDGTLFRSDGTTSISNGDFITFAEGQAGVRFLPRSNSNATGTFDVDLSQDGSTIVTGTSRATGTVSVTPVGDTPQVANITTTQNTLSGTIIISRHSADGAEVTHFRISSITNGTLFKNNGLTQISPGDFITFAEAQAGVKFLPSPGSVIAGHFDVESSQNGSTVSTQSAKATSTVTVLDVTAPTADIVDVTPDPRNTNAGTVTISFSEAVSGVDIADFRLTRDGSAVDISGLTVLGSGSNYTLDLSGVTALSGSYVLTLTAAGSGIQDTTTNLLTMDAVDSLVVNSIDESGSPLDIDGNGVADAATDGILAIRYLFGFRGSVLTVGAIGPSATNGTPAAVESALDASQAMLDVDGNGIRDAATDGILIIRYLFGFRDGPLVTGAIGPNATRSSGAEIAAFLDSFRALPSTQSPSTGSNNAPSLAAVNSAVSSRVATSSSKSRMAASWIPDAKQRDLFSRNEESRHAIVSIEQKSEDAELTDQAFESRVDWLSAL